MKTYIQTSFLFLMFLYSSSILAQQREIKLPVIDTIRIGNTLKTFVIDTSLFVSGPELVVEQNVKQFLIPHISQKRVSSSKRAKELKELINWDKRFNDSLTRGFKELFYEERSIYYKEYNLPINDTIAVKELALKLIPSYRLSTEIINVKKDVDIKDYYILQNDRIFYLVFLKEKLLGMISTFPKEKRFSYAAFGVNELVSVSKIISLKKEPLMFINSLKIPGNHASQNNYMMRSFGFLGSEGDILLVNYKTGQLIKSNNRYNYEENSIISAKRYFSNNNWGQLKGILKYAYPRKEKND